MNIQQTIVTQLPDAVPEAIRLSRDPFDALTQAFKGAGWLVRFKRDTEIQADGEPAEYFYQVETGAVRTYKLLDDGRRQIIAFHLPGDVIELEPSRDYRLSAAAAASSVVRVVRRSAIVAMAQRSADLASEIWRRTSSDLQFAREQQLALGRKNAEERMASFLLQMSDRSLSKPIIELPMGRRDIADYLGLTVETVARSLTQLESTSAIRRSQRQIRLCNRFVLQCLSG
jgi:CRP/FNR family nitrogen fixation transcriptional regulator